MEKETDRKKRQTGKSGCGDTGKRFAVCVSRLGYEEAKI